MVRKKQYGKSASSRSAANAGFAATEKEIMKNRPNQKWSRVHREDGAITTYA